jgi:hypothetical protein
MQVSGVCFVEMLVASFYGARVHVSLYVLMMCRLSISVMYVCKCLVYILMMYSLYSL